MRTFLLTISYLLAVVACAGPPPDLIKVGEIESDGTRFVTYADRATIQKNWNHRNTVRMSSVIESEVPDDRHRVSWKDEWDYECQSKETIPYRFTEFSGRMGTGEKMYSQSVGVILMHGQYGQDTYWMPVEPGSVGEKLWQVACGKE